MIDSYIFTGLGFVTGAYEILNCDIEKYIASGYLEGFDETRIAESPDYQIYKSKTPHPFQDCGVSYSCVSFILNLTCGSVGQKKFFLFLSLITVNGIMMNEI